MVDRGLEARGELSAKRRSVGRRTRYTYAPRNKRSITDVVADRRSPDRFAAEIFFRVRSFGSIEIDIFFKMRFSRNETKSERRNASGVLGCAPISNSKFASRWRDSVAFRPRLSSVCFGDRGCEVWGVGRERAMEPTAPGPSGAPDPRRRAPAPSPSGSGGGNANANENGNGKAGDRRRRRGGACARPGRPKRARSPDTSSSSDGDVSPGEPEDECCVYTYRGGEPMADLRSSFYGLDVGPAAEPRLPAPPLFGPRPEPPNEGRPPSSPDMDYLEMDFDPGPSREVDSPGGSTEPEPEPEPEPPPPPPPLPLPPPEDAEEPPDEPPAPNRAPPPDVDRAEDEPPPSFRDGPSTSEAAAAGPSNVRVRSPPPKRAAQNGAGPSRRGSLIPHASPSGRVLFVRRTRSSWATGEIRGHHSGSGDLVSPGETCEADFSDRFSWSSVGRISPKRAELLEASRANRSSALFHCAMAKKLIVDIQAAKFLQENDTSNIDGSGVDGSEEPSIVQRQMVWTEQEACARQITQIGTSACGATAVINVLLALQQTVDVERVTSAVGTRLRANNAPLCRYIISRAVAGCDHRALSAGLCAGSGGAVSSRHFSTWPERAVSLSHWLAYWIELGGVPIATVNLQAGVMDADHIPDSWHHQMIFGVGPRGVYLTNPVDRIEEGALWHQLCADSTLLIKRKDILSRWNRDTDLTPLIDVPGDERWKTMNVLGQIVNMIRESQNANSTICTTHIRIPACYSAGITIAVLTGSDAHKMLLQAPELPLLLPEDE